MGLGRTTRFAPTPAGARRVNVMRAGRAGLKELAPPPDLFADFQREKAALKRAGSPGRPLETFQRRSGPLPGAIRTSPRRCRPCAPSWRRLDRPTST
jgi:hypothetical protein